MGGVNNAKISHLLLDRSSSGKRRLNLFLAPMEPLTANPVLRELMGDFGANIVCRPKILPQHLLKAKKWQFWERMLQEFKNYYYDGIQLIARLEDPIAPAVKFINHNSRALGINYLDLNFCCPGYKVLPQRRGGELLKEPKIILQVIEKVLKYSEIPVSIKIRKGYTNNDNPKELLTKIHREFGEKISWITINRAPVKMKGINMQNLIQDIFPFKQAIEAVEHKIPIIANGGFMWPEQIIEMQKEIPVAGVMIGRGVMGNPMLFKTTKELFKRTLEGDGQKSNNEKAFLSGLNALLDKFYYYSTHGQGRWTTLGELKRQLYPFIKFKYSSQNKGLPSGYGFDKWHRTKFSLPSFSQALSQVFPEFPHQFWLNWLESLNIRQK